MGNKIIKHSDLELLRKNSDLKHFGILGMRWGVRRYQNEDGTRISKRESRKQAKAKILSEKEQKAIAQMKENKKQEEQEQVPALEKGSKTRITNPDIAKLDKSGQVHAKFYDHTTAPLPKLPMKDIVDALEKEYLDLSKYGFPIPEGGAKKDMVLWSIDDQYLSFDSKVNVTGGHSLDMEWGIGPDKKVKIGGVSMNG